MSNDSGDELDGTQWREVDAVCCRFEAACEAGDRPDLGKYLDGAVEPVRGVLFRELLALELDYRRKRGEQIRRADYERRWAEFAKVLPGMFAEAGIPWGEAKESREGKRMKCPQCGAENGTARDHCLKCGRSLGEATLPGSNVLQCPKCGRVMPAGAKFCGFDRTPLTPNATPVPSSPPPPPAVPPVAPKPAAVPVARPMSPPPTRPAPEPVAKAQPTASSPLPPTRFFVDDELQVGGSARDERREGSAELLSPHGSLREMVLIPLGEVMLGSPDGVGNEDEQPQHKVRLTAFYIDRCAVSNADYERFDPSHKSQRTDVADGDNDPVVMVSYQDALNYCRWRSIQEGLPPETYCLPTEAQWERAARGGYPDRVYPWGDTIRPDLCNTLESGRGRTLPVNQSHPNGFMLFHIGGNVREWCWDFYSRTYYAQKLFPWVDPRGPGPQLMEVLRVVRGASFLEPAASWGRCAARGFADPRGKQTDIGFRCVRPVGVR